MENRAHGLQGEFYLQSCVFLCPWCLIDSRPSLSSSGQRSGHTQTKWTSNKCNQQRSGAGAAPAGTVRWPAAAAGCVCYRRGRRRDPLIKQRCCRSETGGREYANLCGIYMRCIMRFGLTRGAPPTALQFTERRFHHGSTDSRSGFLSFRFTDTQYERPVKN